MKYLIIKLSSLGDQIHLCPGVADLASSYPEATIHWVVQTECSEIAEMQLDTKKVFRLPLQELRANPWKIARWISLFKAIMELRTNYYDLVIDAQGVLKSALLSRLVRRNRVFGFSARSISERGANWLYSETFTPSRGISAVRRGRDLIAAATARSPSGGARYRLRPLSTTTFREDFADCILLVPCASHSEKHWSSVNWINFVKSSKLTSENFRLVWGSEKDRELVDQIAFQSNGRAKPLASRYSISELAGLIKNSKLVVGVDSGVTHLANAIGTTTVMIFSSTHPELFFCPGSPLSSSMGQYGAPPDVNEVLDYVQSILYGPTR